MGGRCALRACSTPEERESDRWWERGKLTGGHHDTRERPRPACICTRASARVILAPHHHQLHLQTTMDGPPDGSIIQLPELDKRTVIGVSVAIAGNVLISLALNLQKLAHRRRDLAVAQAEGQKPQHDSADITRPPNPLERVRELSYEDREEGWPDAVEGELDTIRSPRLEALQPESEPLLPRVSSHGSTGRITNKKRASFFRLFLPAKPPHSDRQPPAMPATPRRRASARPPPMSRASSTTTASSSIVSNGNEIDYLKSKLW